MPGRTRHLAYASFRNYDLVLAETDGRRTLWVHMKVQFQFVDAVVRGQKDGDWTDATRRQFVLDWKRVVRRAWETDLLTMDGSGRRIRFRLALDCKIGGVRIDDFDIQVVRRPEGSGTRSHVNALWNNSIIDYTDIAANERQQIVAAHEFGHMLGLDDEYGEKADPANPDPDSIMAGGMAVRFRHLAKFRRFASSASDAH